MTSVLWTIIIVVLSLIPVLLAGCAPTLSNAFSVDSLAALVESGHLLLALSLTLAAGFLTALSPCVYPIIPITLSVIGARRYESALQGFLVSLSYVSGMIALYVGLGILFSSLGILFGSVFQSPVMLIAVAALFFFFALSMFGATNWMLPDTLLQRLSRFGGSGFRGAFLMGLVSGLIASPCTGPVLAFILTLISKHGDLKTGSLLMAAFGIGMGIPFLLLGTFSSVLSRLPKSGAWMNRIKVVFAVTMLFSSFYFFKLGIDTLTYEPASSGEEWLFIGKKDEASDKLHKALAEYKANGFPVIIDFYADWCVQCHEIDKLTFQNPEVKEALKRFKLIRIDSTTQTDSVSAIQDEFQVVGLPRVVVIDSKGVVVKEINISGFIDAKQFLALLAKIKK